MTERERWVVYPLLFLALGAALRDKLIDRTTTRSIVCQELILVDEQPLGREPELLARIGRPERSSSGRASGVQLLINGPLEVLDHEPSNQLAHRLVTIGRAQSAPNAAPTGLVTVNGQVNVDGAINAKLYAYQGIPIVPALRAVFPGVSLPDLLRVIPQATMPQQEERPPPAVPESTPPVEQPLPTAPPEDASRPPASPQAGERARDARPLDETGENR